jgi:hypothetical protein
MARWARKNGYLLKHTGVDQNPGAIKYLKKHCGKYPEIDGIVSDYKAFLQEDKPVDIIHCSLFCHHLKDEELLGLFRKMNAVAQSGFIVNDLQRNPFAYYGAKLMTRLLNGSPLSKNDGPISVLRGFKRHELDLLLKKAGVKKYVIRRRPGFRFLIVAGRALEAGNGNK